MMGFRLVQDDDNYSKFREYTSSSAVGTKLSV